MPTRNQMKALKFAGNYGAGETALASYMIRHAVIGDALFCGSSHMQTRKFALRAGVFKTKPMLSWQTKAGEQVDAKLCSRCEIVHDVGTANGVDWETATLADLHRVLQILGD